MFVSSPMVRLLEGGIDGRVATSGACAPKPGSMQPFGIGTGFVSSASLSGTVLAPYATSPGMVITETIAVTICKYV